MTDATPPPTGESKSKTAASESLLEDILGSTYDNLHKIFIKKTDLNILERWLARRAGGDIGILSISPPSEKNKYLAMGGSVIANTLLSFMSSFYFFASYANTSMQNIQTLIFCVLASLVVSTIIYNIEFSIVSSKNVTLFTILARFSLAILIGYIFSQPLEALVFKEPIKKQLYLNNEDEIKSFNNEHIARQTRLLKELADFENEIKPIKQLYDDRDSSVKYHCKIYPDAVKCKLWKEKFEEIKLEYAPYQKVVKDKHDEIKKNNIEYNKQKIELKKVQTGDILTQLKALEQITATSPIAWRYYFSITLLLVIFDTLPIIIKITSAKSNYEKVLDFQDELKERERVEIRSFYNNVIESEYKNKLFLKEITHRTATAKKLTEDSVRKSTELLEQTEIFAERVVKKLDKTEKLEPETLKIAHKKRIEKVYDDFFVIFDSTWDKFMTFIKSKPFT